jgi:hypothetical protein
MTVLVLLKTTVATTKIEIIAVTTVMASTARPYSGLMEKPRGVEN